MCSSQPVNTALLLIDIQNDYFPGGKNELKGSLEASRQAGRLLSYFRQARLLPIFIQHIATRPGAKTFLPGTPGAEIHPSVQPLPGETVFQKHYPNSFRETGLLECLRQEQITRLVISGMMTHMCVESTARAAFDLGFECLTAADACATKDLLFAGQTIPAEMVHHAFLAGLQGTYGKVLRVDELISLLS
jgi:nicotinamidase-related amidase